MKNIFLPTMLMVFLTFTSCSKEDALPKETSENKVSDGISKIILTGNQKTKVGTYEMLSFPSWKSFEAKVVDLDSLVSQYETDFNDQYSHLTEEELTLLQDSIGFDVEVPLSAYESSMSITNPLRTKYNLEKNQFSLDSINFKDPNIMYLFDDAELSLLNDRQEVMVAGDVFRFSEDGYIIITADHYNTLVRIDNNDSTVFSEPYVTVYSEKAAGNTCRKWKSSSFYHYYSQGKRMNRIATIRSIPGYCKTKAKMESQWHISSGWKGYNRLMQVGVQANLFDSGNCSTLKKQEWSGMKKRNARKLKKTMTTFGSNLAAQKNVSVQGTFKYAGLITYYSLTW